MHRANTRQERAVKQLDSVPNSELRCGTRSSLHALNELDVLRSEIPRRTSAGDASKDNAIQQGIAAEAIASMDASRRLTRSVQTANDLVTLAEALRRIVDLQAAHAIVNHWGHDRHVEAVAGLEGKIVEEFLAPFVMGLAPTVGIEWAAVWVLGLLLRDLVVRFECCFDVGDGDIVLLGKFAHVAVGLHDATALVVLAVPLNFLRGLAVQAKEET